MNDRKDEEENRLAARAARYVKVGTNVGAVAARVASQRIFGLDGNDASNAAALAAALGGLKGPIMKVAQLLATIPEALPAEYAQELSQLQSQAPPMGPAFVRRRMVAELGPDWAARFTSFEPSPRRPPRSARCTARPRHDWHGLGRQAAVPRHAAGRRGRPQPAQDGVRAACAHEPGGGDGEILKEISARLREELDYELEAHHTALYGAYLRRRHQHPRAAHPPGAVDQAPAHHDLARGPAPHGLQGGPARDRNAIARAMFRAWWFPFSHYGVIHGDPTSSTI